MMNNLSVFSSSSTRHDEFILKIFGIKDINTKNQISSISHEITTKYYTSKVNVHWIGIFEEKDENEEEIIKKSQSCILIIEDFKDFNALKKFYYNLLAKEKFFDSSLFVLVDNHFEKEELEKMLEWSNEEGLEFIDFHEEPTEDKIERRNKVGIDRLHEVLECTIWPEREDIKKIEKKKKEKEEEIDVKLPSFDENFFKSMIKELENEITKDEFEKAMDQMDSLFQEMIDLKMNGGNLNHDIRKEKAAMIAVVVCCLT